jgi:ABC exporter DevB family membrane fusion protein
MKRLLLLGCLPVAVFASWKMLSADPRSAAGVASETGPKAAARSDMKGVGYFEPVSEVRKLMMRTGGVIKKCTVKVGDTVRKGDVLVEMEDATPRAEVELARHNLAMVRADAANVNAGINPYKVKVAEQAIGRLREKLRHHNVEAVRYRLMLASRAVSSQDWEAAETACRQTEAELKEQLAELEHLQHSVTPENRDWQESRVAHARANLELAEERLRETKLLAPFDGTVLKLLKREGEGVSMSEPEPVVLFGDLSRMRIRAEIDERFVRHVAVGQAAVVYGRNLAGQTYRGEVVQVEPIMGDKTVFVRTPSERKDLNVVQVLIDLGPEVRAPAGLQVDVQIEGLAGIPPSG